MQLGALCQSVVGERARVASAGVHSQVALQVLSGIGKFASSHAAVPPAESGKTAQCGDPDVLRKAVTWLYWSRLLRTMHKLVTGLKYLTCMVPKAMPKPWSPKVLAKLCLIAFRIVTSLTAVSMRSSFQTSSKSISRLFTLTMPPGAGSLEVVEERSAVWLALSFRKASRVNALQVSFVNPCRWQVQRPSSCVDEEGSGAGAPRP